jgi:hypothetical protein
LALPAAARSRISVAHVSNVGMLTDRPMASHAAATAANSSLEAIAPLAIPRSNLRRAVDARGGQHGSGGTRDREIVKDAFLRTHDASFELHVRQGSR